MVQIDKMRRTVSLDPRDAAFFQNPYPAYDAIRAAAPVFFWEQYGFWCFSRHAEVSELLRDKRFGRQILHVKSREALGWPTPAAHLQAFDALERHSLLSLEPPEHTRLRTLVNRAFVSRQIDRLGPRIAALAHERIDAFERNGEVELLGAFANPIPVIVIAELLGVPAQSWRQLLDWSHRMVAMYQFGVTRAVEESAAGAAREFSDFLRQEVARKRMAPGDDLISKLIAAEAERGRLSEAELISTCVLLLNAGHEATVHSLGNSVKALLENPSAIAALLDETGRPALVEELLRYDPPLHLFTRYALEDIDYCGVRFKTGEMIGLMLGAANRDPQRFANPDQIDASRSPNPHVSFGAGIHFCVGAPLARLEMQIALPILFQRLPKLALSKAPSYRDAYHFHGIEQLDVEFT